MKSIKKSIRNLLTASALAGAGLAGLINSSESKAHPPSIAGQRDYFSTPLYFGHHHSHNHDIYTHSHHDNSSPHLGLHIMDASLRAMFWGNLIRQQAIEEQRLRTQNPNYDSSNCRIRIKEPINLPQTFIANCYQDFSGNGYVDFPKEFVGIGKTRFNEDESILVGLRLPLGIRGENKKVETRIYKVLSNGDKKLIDKNKRIMSHDNIWRNFRDGKIARDNGTGNYEAEFHFDRRHWNTIEFKILEKETKFTDKITPFVCNWYYESDGVEGIDFDKDTFLGLNKNMYTDDDESLIVGLYLKSDKIKGKSTCIFIDTPSDEDIHWHENPDNYSIVRRIFKTSELLDKYGPGNYDINFKLGDKLLEKRTIHLDHDNPLRDVKVIVEPLGVFERAPKPY